MTESWESLAAYFNELGAAAGDVPQRPQRKTEIDKNWAVVIERTLGNVFAVAERALNARMTPDEDYRLRFWLNMLKLDGPVIMEAVEGPLCLSLLHTLYAFFQIGSLATHSDTGDMFVRREINDAARKAPRNSERQRAVNKAFEAAAAQWDGQHPAKKLRRLRRIWRGRASTNRRRAPYTPD